MENILIYFFMGISLSMDAFSIAISIGTTSPSKEKIRLLTTTIGLFHFFMPLIGNNVSRIFLNQNLIKTNLLTGLIFLFLAFQMIFSKKEEEKIEILKIKTILLIALTVSIDSLTVGFAFGLNRESIYLSSIIFMFISMSFTYFGLLLGKKVKEKLTTKASIIGILIMILLSIKYLFFF